MEEINTEDLTLEGLVHDLNNVFETIGDAADLLEDDEHWAALAATIRRNVDRGMRLVSGFRESGRSFQELSGIVDRATSFVRDFLHLGHGPVIQFHRNCEDGLMIRGIAAEWERVLVNLFMNAVQVMKNGGILEVSARRAGDNLEISVADTGPGIQPEIMDKIFKPRFSTKGRRSGLGLHIVDSIVRKHGGEVCARNRADGNGAEFIISVPAE